MFLLPLYSVNPPCTIFRSSTLGLLRLSCWFTTVQEIVSITMTIMDTKDYLRGGPDGDRSVSISFTSVGKALASRSHSLHMHANPGLIGAGALGVASSSSVDAAPAPAPAAIPLPTSTPKLQPQASAGSSLSMRDTSTNMTVDPSRSHDLLTLDDVSECDSAALSARQDEAPLTVAVKPTVYGTSAGAFIVQPPLLFGFNDTDLAFPFFVPTPTDAGGIALQGAVTPLAGANMISPQAKVIDAGLRAIIADMVRGIEVAVWDAAMER